MKRFNEEEPEPSALKPTNSQQPPQSTNNDVEMGEFEDPYGDDFESEEEIFEAGENGMLEDENEDEDDNTNENKPKESEDDLANTQRVYIPHRSAPLGPNEQMEPDHTTYVMLHSFSVKWPSLSFSIISDQFGPNRTKFPHEMFLVSGTQASKPKDNEVNIIRLSQLCKTLQSENDDDDEDDDDDMQMDPLLESRDVNCNNTVNRVRLSNCNRGAEIMAAALLENGDLQVFEISSHVKSLGKAGQPWSKKPVYIGKQHKRVEGYALDWSSLEPNTLLSGDSNGNIYLTTKPGKEWATDPVPYTAKSSGSIEEIQFSPVEKNVFMSTGSDGFLRVWSVGNKSPVLQVKIADCDVNVMSWNKRAPHLVATGHDDGVIAVWDLRTFQKGKPVAKFDFHKQPITSIEWNPNDETVLVAASEDSTVSIWDLSVEADDQTKEKEVEGVPPQLLFLHWQPNAKEAHWHPQIPGAIVSTGSDGFSVWKSISV